MKHVPDGQRNFTQALNEPSKESYFRNYFKKSYNTGETLHNPCFLNENH